jgi:hypothetical protein
MNPSKPPRRFIELVASSAPFDPDPLLRPVGAERKCGLKGGVPEPAEACQHGLVVRGGRTTFRLEALEDLDRGDVGLEAFNWASEKVRWGANVVFGIRCDRDRRMRWRDGNQKSGVPSAPSCGSGSGSGRLAGTLRVRGSSTSVAGPGAVSPEAGESNEDGVNRNSSCAKKHARAR